jgi:DNA-directed RNA polymerase subunit RPC12/RpoP
MCSVFLARREKPTKVGEEFSFMLTPGADGDELACPACESNRIEDITAAESPGSLTYRCLDCTAEFDESGGRVVP